MIYCYKCNAKNENNSKYCINCGKEINLNNFNVKYKIRAMIQCPKCESTEYLIPIGFKPLYGEHYHQDRKKVVFYCTKDGCIFQVKLDY